MAKCDHCQQRKGKRACPHLSGHICSTCCGENRGINFDCPRDCPYFGPPATRGEDSSTAPAPAEPTPDLSRYQKYLSSNRRVLADLMARIELAMARFDRERRGLVDADVVTSLQFMRRRASPITMVEQFAPEMGAFLEKAIVESYRGGAAPGPYDLMEVLDHLIETARNFGPVGSRRYLDELALFEKHSQSAGNDDGPKKDDSPRIILPR